MDMIQKPNNQPQPFTEDDLPDWLIEGTANALTEEDYGGDTENEIVFWGELHPTDIEGEYQITDFGEVDENPWESVQYFLDNYIFDNIEKQIANAQKKEYTIFNPYPEIKLSKDAVVIADDDGTPTMIYWSNTMQ